MDERIQCLAWAKLVVLRGIGMSRCSSSGEGLWDVHRAHWGATWAIFEDQENLGTNNSLLQTVA